MKFGHVQTLLLLFFLLSCTISLSSGLTAREARDLRQKCTAQCSKVKSRSTCFSACYTTTTTTVKPKLKKSVH